jgi:nitrogen regulatory protein P-II 1
MKLITAIIRPHQLPAVKQELYDAQVYKITVSNVLGCGEEEGYQETYRGVEHEVTLLKKVRLEIAVNEDFVEPTVEAIIRAARTNEVGDGKIFITDLQECIRIRTGERGQRAIG